MNCLTNKKEGAELLLDYCAGSLDAARKAEIGHHLETCAGCRRAVAIQRELWETLDRWTPPAVSQNFDARLYARTAAEDAAPGWKRWALRIFEPAVPLTAWKPAVSLVAAFAVLAVGLSLHTADPVENRNPQMHAEKVDIEQVATALDDLDLLTPASPM